MSRTSKRQQDKLPKIIEDHLLNVPEAQPVVFKVQAPPQSRVFLAGTFNQWDAHATPLSTDGNGGYALRMRLAPGKYEYKFVVNGQWLLDPANRSQVPNGLGSYNNVREVT